MGKGIFPVEDDPRLRTSDADARLRNHSVSVSTAGSTWNLGVQPQGLVVMCPGLLSFETSLCLLFRPDRVLSAYSILQTTAMSSGSTGDTHHCQAP